MNPINVMVNGLPGNVARTVARHIQNDPRFELLSCSLTGPEIADSECAVESTPVALIGPAENVAAHITIQKANAVAHRADIANRRRKIIKRHKIQFQLVIICLFL